MTSVDAVEMSDGRLCHAVQPATKNACLPSCHLVHCTKRLAQASEYRVAHVVTDATGTRSSYMLPLCFCFF